MFEKLTLAIAKPCHKQFGKFSEWSALVEQLEHGKGIRAKIEVLPEPKNPLMAHEQTPAAPELKARFDKLERGKEALIKTAQCTRQRDRTPWQC